MASSPGRPIKLSYNPYLTGGQWEIRKFMLKENADEYEQLVTHARNLFPRLSDEPFTITYLDEDDDCITISSLDELRLALLHSQTTTFELRLVDAATRWRQLQSELSSFSDNESETSAPEINHAVHHRVACDDCGMYPIRGNRYKCSIRRDFDLCSACESKKVQPYPMLKIYNHRQTPASLVVTLHDDQFLNEQVDGDVFVGDNVDAKPVTPEVQTGGSISGGGRRCGQQGRKLPRCFGKGRHPPNLRRHIAPIPPLAPGGRHPQGPPFQPPFQHGSPRRGRGGCHGPFNQPFLFPRPFGRCQQQQQWQQQQQEDSSTQDARRTESSSVPPNITSEEMKENLANAVSSVFTGVASMVNSNLHEESQSSTATSESSHNIGESSSKAAKQAAVNMMSSIFTNVANVARDVVRNSSSNYATATAPSASTKSQTTHPPQSKILPKAALIEDVTFSPNSIVPAGASFVKTWKVQNTGEKPWPKDLRLEVCGTDYIFSNPSKDLGDLTATPGESVDLSITLIAPAEIGTYVEYFALRDSSSIIGPYLCVDIQVIEGGDMGDWNVVTSTPLSGETSEESNIEDGEIKEPFGTWKIHMKDHNGHIQFFDTNGDTIFQLAFDNNFMTMNSCVQSEWGGAEFVPINPKQIPFEAMINITEEGFEISFEGPKRYVFRDGKHHFEAGEKILYMYNHRVPIRFFRGEVKTSGDKYNIIRVSSKQQKDSESVCNDSASAENADMQEEMYCKYALELQHLADMGFTNFAVLFPILKAMVPVPASETESGKVNVEQINEVVAMLVARTS